MSDEKSVAKDWLKNTFSQYFVSPILKYLVADIAIPVIIMLLLLLYVLIRRKIMGKKVAHQVTTEELTREADKVALPEKTVVQNQVSPTEVNFFLPLIINNF